MTSEIWVCPKSTLEQVLHKKSTKMHWYVYNNTVPSVNIAKLDILSSIYVILKFLNLALFRLPAGQPAIRPGSTSTMAPDFSHKKCNHI